MGGIKFGIVLTGLSLVALPSEMAKAQTPVLQYEVVDFSALTGYPETFGFGLSELGHTLIRAGTEGADSRNFFVFDEGNLIELVDFTPAGGRGRPSANGAPTSPMNSVGQIISRGSYGLDGFEFTIYDDGTITPYQLPAGLDPSELDVARTINIRQDAIVEGGMSLTGVGSGILLLSDNQSTVIGNGSCEHDCDLYEHDFLVALSDNGMALFNQESAFGRAGWVYDTNTGEKRFLMPDVVPPNGEVNARSINNHGTVVGEHNNEPFIWQDGEVTFLHPLVDPESELTFLGVRAINDLDQILFWGNYTVPGPSQYFIFDDGQLSIAPIFDLLPGTQPLRIADFNARGEILVNSLDRAFLLIPIPEPAGLGIVALAALLLPRRRRPTATRHRLT